MGRRPCCPKEINKGAWSREEDDTLSKYVSIHGEGKWQKVAQTAGLKRCGKSCRQRWLNYLKPGIKRGDISLDEEEMIIRLHRLLGNRWALIAKRLPGRTDNEIKNYWNTNLSKKLLSKKQPTSSSSLYHSHKHYEEEKTKLQTHVAPEAPRARRVKGAVLQYTTNADVRYRYSSSPTKDKIEEVTKGSEEEEDSLTDFLIDIDDQNQQLEIGHDEEYFNSKLPQIFEEEKNNNKSDNCDSDEKFDPLESLLDVELKRVASFLGLEND